MWLEFSSNYFKTNNNGPIDFVVLFFSLHLLIWINMSKIEINKKKNTCVMRYNNSFYSFSYGYNLKIHLQFTFSFITIVRNSFIIFSLSFLCRMKCCAGWIELVLMCGGWMHMGIYMRRGKYCLPIALRSTIGCIIRANHR